MLVPHISGFSPVASVMSFRTTLLSSRRLASGTFARKPATLSRVGLVFVFASAMRPPFARWGSTSILFGWGYARWYHGRKARLEENPQPFRKAPWEKMT